MNIVYSPAECVHWCSDMECPYAHIDTWEYNGDVYYTKEEALKAKKINEPEEFMD